MALEDLDNRDDIKRFINNVLTSKNFTECFSKMYRDGLSDDFGDELEKFHIINKEKAFLALKDDLK